MPATSDKQRRFFGAVLAYKRGGAKGVSSEVKKAAESMSEKSVVDFASKHHSTPLRGHKR